MNGIEWEISEFKQFWTTLPKALKWSEMIDIIQAAKAGNVRAREQVIECNLRLVANVVLKKRYRIILHGLALLDAFQEGAFGISRALEKYELKKGNRFSTYAYWWIDQSINRFVQNGRLVRLPVHLSEKQDRIAGSLQRLKNSAKPVTYEAIAEEINARTIARNADKPTAKPKIYSPKDVANAITYLPLPRSLDQECVVDSDGLPLLLSGVIADHENVFDRVAAKELYQRIAEVLDSFTEEQRLVAGHLFRRSFHKEPHQEFCDRVGITWSQFRSLKRVVLARLRDQLQDYREVA